MLEGMAGGERLALPDIEVEKAALALERTFVQRWDIHARQLDDGRYICVHKPLNNNHLAAHLRGEITLGTYVLTAKSKARFIVMDADDDREFDDLLRLSRSIKVDEVPVHLELSRRGGHLWIFFERPVPGKDAREFGMGFMKAYRIDGVELFPKQDRLSGGPGSLVRMPFGVHRLTGERYGFITPDGEPLAPTMLDQIQMLSSHESVSKGIIDSYRQHSLSLSPKAILDSPESPRETLSDRIKDSITVLEFVSRYVDLKPVGSGAIGLCPFHEDHNPSFGVNDKGNYWHCFAGCGGGSVIDFWMKWRGCEFTEALIELAGLLD